MQLEKTNNFAPRISGWINYAGLDYAIDRARRAMVFYRRIYLTDTELLDKDKHSLLMTYLELKEFLRTEEVNYEPEKSEAYKRLTKRDGDTEDASSLQDIKEESEESVQGDEKKWIIQVKIILKW